MSQESARSRRRYLRGAVALLGGTALGGCSGGEAPPDAGTASETSAGAGGGRSGTTAVDGDRGTDGSAGTVTAIHAGYETTEVTVRTPDEDVLGSVTAAVADTPELRYRGLSDTGSLPEDRGMLFVYDGVDDRTYVMREMDFGLDIVYADGEGAITGIHHAPAPGPDEDGEDQRYPGRGKYVLEVNYDWTTDRGVDVGDVLAFER